MTLRVIGAGVGRTGTASLQAALQLLLDGRCYHMFEIQTRPDDVPVWHAAARGELPDWRAFLADFVAAVDWPACAYWAELAAAFPDALIVLSTRSDAETWWNSASTTIFPALHEIPDNAWRSMVFELLARRFTPDFGDAAAAMAAYEAHNAAVRARAPRARLLEWQPGDGWQPLCAALGVAVPDAPFPHTNSSAEFHARMARRRSRS